MVITFNERLSDSPFVERVWRSQSGRGGRFLSIANCHWEMVVTHLAGKYSLTVRGPERSATALDCPPEGEWVAIRFKLGTCMPLLPPGELRDCNVVTLPNASRRAFWLNGSAMEFPDFENAETFVQRFVRKGLIVSDPAIRTALRGAPTPLTTRSAERRFQQITGLTQGQIRQIERARQATLLLRRGVSILDACHATGYYDQAHLTRSVQRFIGLTPAQIATGREQLSFLYNPEAD